MEHLPQARAPDPPGNPELVLIRTPLRRLAGQTVGGPLRVRVQGRPAYAAFADRSLARVACEHWSIDGEVHLEPWPEALRHEDPASGVRHLLVFGSRADFDLWLRDPLAYPVEERLVPLALRTQAEATSRDGPGR